MNHRLVYTTLAASLSLFACKQSSVTDEAEPAGTKPIAAVNEAASTGALEPGSEGLPKARAPIAARTPLSPAAEPIEERVTARAKLSPVEGLAGSSGDARFYRDTNTSRVNISLTAAEPGTYGVYLGTHCKRADIDDVSLAKGATALRSEILVGTIDIGSNGMGTLDAAVPEGHEELGKSAIMLMPKDADAPVKKLTCGHVMLESAAPSGS